jgi:hypothetical protein
MRAAEATVAALFAGKAPTVSATYAALLAALAAIGPYREEPKQTSIHLAKTTGFAGVHPRKGWLILNLRTAQPITSPRVVKREQVSAHRWHNEVKLTTPDEVDAELVGWLQDAYDLG